MQQPGPVYDNAIKFVAATDVGELCRWLGIPLGPNVLQLSESLPGQTMQADLLVESDAGCISQIEFVTHVTTDLPRRLVAYRARVMERHPDHSLQQHVLVLGRGTVSPEVRDAKEFWMRMHVFYARDQDPADLLKSPSLAPLAVLGRASGRKERQALLRAALQAIGAGTDLNRRRKLTDTATTLAAIRLDRATIETIWEETDVPIDIRDTDLARSFVREGREEGLRQGRGEVWAANLRWRFGPDERIAGLATALARLPLDRAGGMVGQADSVEALARALGEAR
jgi:hypothetical protein